MILAASRSLPEFTESANEATELVGKTDYDIHPEAVADAAYRLDSRAIAEGRRVNELQQLGPRMELSTGSTIENTRSTARRRDHRCAGNRTGHHRACGIAVGRLRESEESLRDAQEIAGLSNFALDIPSRTWRRSPELEALLGIDAAYGREFDDIWPLIHPDDRPAMAERLETYYQGQRTLFDSEYRILRHTDGAVRWVHTRGRLELNAAGKPLTLRGTVQDITERKQAEAALRKSEESLREAQKIAGLGSYALDIPSGVWTSSAVMDEIFGIDRAYERTIDGWRDLLHPDDRMAMSAYFQHEVLGQGKPFDKEYRIVRRSDGVERWVHGMGRLSFDAQGRPVAMHGTIQDITESKHVEAALRQSKELLQQFVEHAPAALAMFDRDMRYLAVSQRWLESSGLSEREVIGRSHYELVPEIPESWREEHRRALAGESIHAEEGLVVRADGRKGWLRRELMPWRAHDGTIGGIMVFVDDVTRQKEIESRLRLAATVFTGAREGIHDYRSREARFWR